MCLSLKKYHVPLDSQELKVRRIRSSPRKDDKGKSCSAEKRNYGVASNWLSGSAMTCGGMAGATECPADTSGCGGGCGGG